MLWRLLPTILALPLLGAHFLRSGWLPLTLALALLPLLLFHRRLWVPRLLQSFLVGGSLIWGHTAWQLVQLRSMHHLPYGRLVLILGAVILFTLLAAGLLSSRRVQQHYQG